MVDGLVTAPISKEAWAMAGVPYRDHTGYLSDLTGREAEMILGVPSRKLWCVLVTRHVPLMSVGKSLSPKRIAVARKALSSALKTLGLRSPRLAVCALNPHAGEGGLLGRDVRGALPADSAWRLHVEGELDGLVCLYHDQALIPLKAVGGLAGVNWSVGLPFIRTSPAHGTGFDIAGRRRADPSATVEAARLAAALVRRD
jgi:4-hydroxythreonine-4-phosphate dehydrogenase